MIRQEKVKVRAYSLIAIASVLLITAIAPKAGADSTPSQEYQVKAAFLYNFIQFVDWPEGKLTDNNEPIIIGIIGKDPFEDAFKPIEDKKVKDKNVIVQRFKSFEDLKNSADKPKALTKCHLLFIGPSEEKNLKEIIDTVKNHSVLTVGEMNGFLENGGIINWFVEDKKIRFEINNAAAGRANLKIRSNLLRLAKRVVEDDSVQGNTELKPSSWAGINRNAYFAKHNNKV
jgi:hypothetical protein